jgi:Protein of unknown function (DUF1549)/Protein of unknown function (DUF1553)/Planctomycete cytochrome C
VRVRTIVIIASLVIPIVLTDLRVIAQSTSDQFFETRIRPVLTTRCYACHSSKLDAPKGELVLDTRAGVLKGGKLGPAVVPGNPSESRLLQAIRYLDPHLQMPPSGKLADSVIADFERWITEGAHDPRVETGSGEAAGAASAKSARRVVDERELAKGRQWWAFQPVRELPAPASAVRASAFAPGASASAPPAPADKSADKPVAAHSSFSSGVRTKLDHFVLAKLREKGLTPSAEADPGTLVRRAYVDLVGVKPTYEEAEAFTSDRSPDRYEKLIDRLLASPQYGERWARYWLDVVRYAEDNPGNITNPPYPHAWQYRDWVIKSLNEDVPYDRFLKLQLAADLMPGASRSDMRALGIIALGPQDHKDVRLSVDVVGTIQLNDWDERLDTVSRGILGLSVACARCHDHKFDPIQQKDYYRLLSVFASTQRALRPSFAIDPQTETRFMWVYQRMFDLHYTANLLENEPGSKPEQAARQVKKFREELAQLQAEIDRMSAAHPEIGAYIRSVPYPGERDPAAPQAAAEKKTLPADLVPNSARQANARGPRAPRKRIDPQAPFLNSVYDAGLWWDDSEPDLTFFNAKPGVPRDLPLYRGGNLSSPGDPAPRGFPLVLAKGPAEFHNGSGRLELAERIFTDAAPLTARVIVNRVWGWHFDKHLVGTPSDFGVQGLQPTHPELLDDLSARFIANGWSLKWLHREIMLSATYRQSSRPRSEAGEVDPANQWLWRMNPRRMDIEAYRDTLLRISGTLDTTMYGPSQDIDTGRRRTVYSTLSRGRSSADIMKLYDAPPPMAHSPMRHLTINPLQALFVMNSGFVQTLASELAKTVENRSTPKEKIQALHRTVFARNAEPEEVALGLTYLNSATVASYAQALLSTNEVIFWP